MRCHHSKEFSHIEPFVSRICLGKSVVTSSERDLGSVPSGHRPTALIAEELQPQFPGETQRTQARVLRAPSHRRPLRDDAQAVRLAGLDGACVTVGASQTRK